MSAISAGLLKSITVYFLRFTIPSFTRSLNCYSPGLLLKKIGAKQGMQVDISTLDSVIVGVYFILVMALGLWVSRRTKGGEDLFLAGRRLGWFSIGMSLFASNISSTTIIGLAGAAYAWGIAVSNYEWAASLVLIVFCFTLLPLYLRSRVSTVPEFLEKRYSKSCRKYFAGLTLFNNIIIDTAGGLFAGAMVIQTFYPSVDLYTACIVLAVFGGIYTAAGGLAAVVYTDVLQATILLFGCSFVAYLCWQQIGGDWSIVQQTVSAKHLSVILPADDPDLPWTGTLIGVPILGFYFWCTNQFITQRVLGAKSVNDARWGALFAGLLKLPVLFIMVIPGTMALVFLPDLATGDLVFPIIIVI